jgi:hypothetical protein
MPLPAPVDPADRVVIASTTSLGNDDASSAGSPPVERDPARRSEYGSAGERKPIAVPPTGWRRTRYGWEHVSTWPTLGSVSGKSINEVIEQQIRREPPWARALMSGLSEIPPVAIAMVQLTAIFIVLFIADRCRRRPA